MTLFDTNFRKVVETPFSVRLEIHVHKETRGKNLIKSLSDLGLSIKWMVIKIKNNLENAHPNNETGIPLHLAVDNIDFKDDIPDEKAEFHGNTLVVFQKSSQLNRELLKIRQTKSFTFQHIPFQENEIMKPNPPNKTFSDYEVPSSSVDVSSYRNADCIWGLCKVTDEKRVCQLPTWNAFNSLLSALPKKTVFQGLPL